MVNSSGLPVASGERPRVLVLRYHSLGDCVLATGVTRVLAATARVTVATEEKFRPVFDGLPWIERVLTREQLEAGRGRADDVREAGIEERIGNGPVSPYDRVIDLQGTPGARRLARALGRAASTVHTRSAARRWLVLWGDRFPRPRVPHAVQRYAEAAGLVGPAAVTICRPEARVSAEEEAEARRMAPEAFAFPSGTAIAMVTGASRRTKEYPAERFAEVARVTRAAGLPTWWIEPPGRGHAQEIAGMPVLRLPLGPLKAVLARARAVAVSDSGPMHLAAALGAPVLAIFGSTVTGFGFAPLGARTRVLEAIDVACRPCGVHGRDHCWLGHWRCLRDLAPARVAEELLVLAGEPNSREETDERRGA
jgi:ADP-heptose:LPS heptosyltransferase